MAKAPATTEPATTETAGQAPAAVKSPAKKVAPKKRSAKKRAAKKAAPSPVAAHKRASKKAAGKKRKKRRPVEVTNKAQAIRDEAKKLGKKVRPKDIIAALSAKGITVSSPQVSTTLKSAGYRRVRRGKKAKTAAAAGASQTPTFAVTDLLLAKKLADQLGGTARLKDVVSALERLQ